MSRCIQKKKALIFPRKINTLCINRYSFFPLQVIMVQHTVSMIHTAFFPNLPAFKNQTFRKTGFSSVNMGQKAQNDIFHLLLPVLRFRLFCIMIRKEYSRTLLCRKNALILHCPDTGLSSARKPRKTGHALPVYIPHISDKALSSPHTSPLR